MEKWDYPEINIHNYIIHVDKTREIKVLLLIPEIPISYPNMSPNEEATIPQIKHNIESNLSLARHCRTRSESFFSERNPEKKIW